MYIQIFLMIIFILNIPFVLIWELYLYFWDKKFLLIFQLFHLIFIIEISFFFRILLIGISRFIVIIINIFRYWIYNSGIIIVIVN